MEVSEVLITYVTNRRKARVLHIGAGHSSNCQIIPKLFGYTPAAGLHQVT